jgi:hypothetical protein
MSMENMVQEKIGQEGAVVERPFIRVVFQRGLPPEVGINGCRVEDVIGIAIDRLLHYQQTPLACEENVEALHFLSEARESLVRRRQRREAQGVLNTMERHEPVRTEDEEEDFSATSS